MKKLFEAADDSPVSGMMRDKSPPESVDAEIDALITQYEKESIETKEEQEEKKMFESLKHLSLRFLLEAEGDDPAAGDAPPSAGESPPAAATPEKAEKEEIPPLDITQFTSKIARLVSNASNLLPVEEVIVSRAIKYLRENYEENYVEQMLDILNNQYDFDLDGDEDIVDVPISVGAGTKAAGG